MRKSTSGPSVRKLCFLSITYCDRSDEIFTVSIRMIQCAFMFCYDHKHIKSAWLNPKPDAQMPIGSTNGKKNEHGICVYQVFARPQCP